MFSRNNILIIIPLAIFVLFGCAYPGISHPEKYPAPKIEADWIRNAEPIEFENERWYPVDDVENLLDDEMLPMGEYRSVKFFVEKEDIKPYGRIYTKFASHKYRVFERAQK